MKFKRFDNHLRSAARSLGAAFCLLAVVLACATAASPVAAPVMGCSHQPAGRGQPFVPSGEWDDRAQMVLDTLSDPVAVAAVVVGLWPMQDAAAKAEVAAALASVRDDLLPDLRAALEAGRRGQADAKCRASAALRGVSLALRGVAVTLARVMRWDVSDGLRMGLSLALALADELNPSCAPDAGWSGLGLETQRVLGARGQRLRPFPTEEEAREERSR